MAFILWPYDRGVGYYLQSCDAGVRYYFVAR